MLIDRFLEARTSALVLASTSLGSGRSGGTGDAMTTAGGGAGRGPAWDSGSTERVAEPTCVAGSAWVQPETRAREARAATIRREAGMVPPGKGIPALNGRAAKRIWGPRTPSKRGVCAQPNHRTSAPPVSLRLSKGQGERENPRAARRFSEAADRREMDREERPIPVRVAIPIGRHGQGACEAGRSFSLPRRDRPRRSKGIQARPIASLPRRGPPPRAQRRPSRPGRRAADRRRRGEEGRSRRGRGCRDP